MPPSYHTEAGSVTWVYHSCKAAAITMFSPRQDPITKLTPYSLKLIHMRLFFYAKKKSHIKFPPLQPMERVAHTASKPFKSFSLSQFGLLSSQEMLLPPSAQRTSVLFKFRESSHYSGWKQQNVILWVHQLQESFGMRTKAYGKNKYIKGIVTLTSMKQDFAQDQILVKGAH